MTGATLQQAESARQKLADRLAGLAVIRGLGIAVLADGYGVKVNLLEQTKCDELPSEVDGVPVVIAVVGAISAL